MGIDKSWILCRHVMDGSAETVNLRPNGICVCELCAANVNIVETEQVHILEEDRLIGMLKDFKNIKGREHIQ